MLVRSAASAGLAPAAAASIRAMLDEAFAGDFSDDDWDHALGGVHYWIEADDGAIVCHGSVIERTLVCGDRRYRTGYVEAVATAPHLHRRGYASEVMRCIGAQVRQGFEVGALSTGAPGFYARLGWELWRGPVMAATETGAIESMPDEEGGIMILRTAATIDLDLDACIVADWRTGDVW
ncbi:MAG: GNAT family N-acetyltransferase [Bryobacteraceae bacterium]